MILYVSQSYSTYVLYFDMIQSMYNVLFMKHIILGTIQLLSKRNVDSYHIETCHFLFTNTLNYVAK